MSVWCRRMVTIIRSTRRSVCSYPALWNDNDDDIDKHNRRTLPDPPDRCLFSEKKKFTLRDLKQEYNSRCAAIIEADPLTWDVPVHSSSTDVFSTNVLDLSELTQWGFDYDYTLSIWRPNVLHLIYELAREYLVHDKRYPSGVQNMSFDENFAIRGLHFDKVTGVLFKLDAARNIQVDTVHRGLTRLDPKIVEDLYSGLHIPDMYIASNRCVNLADLFSLPLASLLAGTISFFQYNYIQYLPEDVSDAISAAHERMRPYIIRKPAKYLDTSIDVRGMLETLHSRRVKIFLLTNSGFNFVNSGMRYILGDDWRDYFDLIIVDAKKPNFFTDSRPFRRIDLSRGEPTWNEVVHLRKGQVYCEGNARMLKRLTGWEGRSTLYVGDHLTSDLRDPSRNFGWRTALIVQELSRVVEVSNSRHFHALVVWKQSLMRLMRHSQHLDSNCPEVVAFRRSLAQEMDVVQADLKVIYCTVRLFMHLLVFDAPQQQVFSPAFGSLFRSYNLPSYFASTVAAFADVYTTSVDNITRYPKDFKFVPSRVFLPHEEHIRRNDDGSFRLGS